LTARRSPANRKQAPTDHSTPRHLRVLRASVFICVKSSCLVSQADNGPEVPVRPAGRANQDAGVPIPHCNEGSGHQAPRYSPTGSPGNPRNREPFCKSATCSAGCPPR
jgi:hypothetical protein